MMKGHSKTKANSIFKAAAALALSVGLVLTGTSLLQTTALAAEGENATMYAADYATFEEQQAAAAQLNQDMADEAFILLKNADDMLPFDVGVKNISVFGVRSDNLQMGGGGSGSSSSDNPTTLAQALTDAGFNLNPKLQAIYARDNNPTVEADVDTLTYAQQSYKLYNDAALVVISRPGSEFVDNEINNVAGHSDPTDHILMLQDNEKALLEHVKENFENVVVILNTPAPVEIAALEDDPDIKGIIWVGLVGDSGISALGRILNGEVNPSGRTTDVWAVNQKKDPTWQNYATNEQTNYTENDDGTVTFTRNDQFKKEDGTDSGVYQVHYEEGIYMGYRWYETADEEGVLTDPAVGYVAADGTIPADKNGDSYYNRSNGVVYPFGYGLSYTDFEWEVVDSNAGAIAKNGKVEFTVKVTNVGSVAGKDVVEVYGTPEYYEGGIEKASVNLIDFAKTDMLRPGQSQEIDFSIDAFDLASFDYNDANGNGFVGYELEAGDYTVSLRKNSHEAVATIGYTVTEDESVETETGATGITWAEDPFTGSEIEAWFSQEDLWNSAGDETSGNVGTVATYDYMTRADMAGTFPDPPTEEELIITDEAFNEREDLKSEFSYEDKETDAWYKTEEDIPDDWTQAGEDDVAARVDGKTEVQLWDMSGIPYDDDRWTEFMNQMTYAEMVTAISSGYYENVAVEAIGKPYVIDQDGPAQLKGGNKNGGTGYMWMPECTIGATWSVDLCEKWGIAVGNDSLFIGTSGWYGPAVNLHRNALAGRNFEYLSQDGVHAGKLAAKITAGAASKGVHVYLKHCVLNDQEQSRDVNGGVATFCTEQALREQYLKAFEIPLREGNCNGLMSSFNSIGAAMPGANYRIFQNIVEDEWGIIAANVSDWYGRNNGTGNCATQPGNILARAGIMPLGSYQGTGAIGRQHDGEWNEAMGCVTSDTSATDDTQIPAYTQWYAVRHTAQKLLYVVANSNAMENGLHDATYAAKSFEATAGEAVSFDVTETYDYAETVQYVVSEGALPAGLTLNENGTITGAATEAGTFTATVTVVLDAYIQVSGDVTVTVAPNATCEVGDTIEQEVTLYQVGDEYGSGWSAGEITAVNATITGSDIFKIEGGKLVGTPTAPGFYNVTLTQEITYDAGWFGTRTVTETTTLVVEVTGEAIEVPEGKDIISVEAIENGYRINFSDGTYIDIFNGEDGADGEDGAQGPAGPEGPAGPQGEKGEQGEPGAAAEGGCGGSIAGFSAIGLAAAAVGASIIAIRRKKSN